MCLFVLVSDLLCVVDIFDVSAGKFEPEPWNQHCIHVVPMPSSITI